MQNKTTLLINARKTPKSCIADPQSIINVQHITARAINRRLIKDPHEYLTGGSVSNCTNDGYFLQKINIKRKTHLSDFYKQ